MPDSLGGSVISLERTYVDPFVTEGQSDTASNLADYVSAWLEREDSRQLALLGGYGQGKSSAALMTTLRMLQSEHSSRVPILIELRGMSPRNLEPLTLFGSWAAPYEISPRALMSLNESGRLLIIFDGFDEMALVGDQRARLDHFRTLWKFAVPGSKVMFTGRPNFFFDDAELREALGIAAPIGNRPYCVDLRLQPFSSEQISIVLESYGERVSTQIRAAIDQSPDFLDLVSRPSLLQVLASLLATNDDEVDLSALTSASLLDLLVQRSYRRQGRKESGLTDFMVLNSSERAYFMSGIATCMAVEGWPNQIDSRQLFRAIGDLAAEAPETVSVSQRSTIDDEVIEPLAERMQSDENAQESVATDVRATGLLVDDPARPNGFRFGHKSFMEYLVAELVGRLLFEPDPGSAAVARLYGANRIFRVALQPEILSFVMEIAQGRLSNSENGSATPAGERGTAARHVLVSMVRSRPLLLRPLVSAFFRIPVLNMRPVTLSLLAFFTVFSFFSAISQFVDLPVFSSVILADESLPARGLFGLEVLSALNIFTVLAMLIQVVFAYSLNRHRLTFLNRRTIASEVRLWFEICHVTQMSDDEVFRALHMNWLPSVLLSPPEEYVGRGQ